MYMLSKKIYNLTKFHNHNTIYEYFTDQNNVNFWPFFHNKKHFNGYKLTKRVEDLKFGMYMLSNKIYNLAKFHTRSSLG